MQTALQRIEWFTFLGDHQVQAPARIIRGQIETANRSPPSMPIGQLHVVQLRRRTGQQLRWRW
jgi:hypothetical protein